MRRIKLVLAAVAAMVAIAVVPGTAIAQDLFNCEFVGYDTFGNELYLCGDDVENDFGEAPSNCAFVGYDTYGDELYLCEVDVEDNSGEEEEEEEEDGLFDEEEDGLFDEEEDGFGDE
jgi:hypothetical protein